MTMPVLVMRSGSLQPYIELLLACAYLIGPHGKRAFAFAFAIAIAIANVDKLSWQLALNKPCQDIFSQSLTEPFCG